MASYDPLSLPNNSLNNPGIGPDGHGSEQLPATVDYIPQAPVVSSPGQVKKKGVVQTALEDAAYEALRNYIIPKALEFGYEVSSGFFAYLFKQDPKRYSSPRALEPSRGTWVKYREASEQGSRSQSTSSRLEREALTQRGKVDIRIMEYSSFADAMDVKDIIEEWFDIHKYVSVLRVYEWSDRAYDAPITARDWGWYDISGLSIREDRQTGKGYLIFPRVVMLNKEDR